MSDTLKAQSKDNEYIITGDKLQGIVDKINEKNQMPTGNIISSDDEIFDTTKPFAFVRLKKDH